jgi:hypothetical protein
MLTAGMHAIETLEELIHLEYLIIAMNFQCFNTLYFRTQRDRIRKHARRPGTTCVVKLNR